MQILLECSHQKNLYEGIAKALVEKWLTIEMIKENKELLNTIWGIEAVVISSYSKLYEPRIEVKFHSE